MCDEWNSARRHDECGASAAEFALLASLIAAVIVGAVGALGLEVLSLYTDTCSAVAGVIPGSSC